MHSEAPPSLSALLKEICSPEARQHQLHLSITAIDDHYPYHKSLATTLANIFHPDFTFAADFSSKTARQNTIYSSSEYRGVFTFIKDSCRLIIFYPHAAECILPPDLTTPGSISFLITCAEYPSLLTELQCEPDLVTSGSAVICIINQPSYELMRKFDATITFEYSTEGREQKLTLSYISASTMPLLNESLFSTALLNH